MNADEIVATNKIIEKFILKPETFVLFRGEGKVNKSGLHFALGRDKDKKDIELINNYWHNKTL